ncbi:C-C motif chemokine 20 [Rhinatrema bivittatum]|uniref:C-C motif chemokine 20 n=1 Tax=Rhinatrema bivittatum TaxID=194408 RepID=UPI00112A9852|nr:C-C motif chemokine 20 [Rhinatrema bivittatum]
MKLVRCSSGAVLLASLLVLGLLCLFGLGEATYDLDCCYTYSKKQLPRKVIKSFTLQRSNEVCDIDAVIFHTKKRFNVCANPQEPWVKSIVASLRRKNKKVKA